MAGFIDNDKEVERLIKSVEKLDKEIERVNNKLDNPGFTDKASPDVIDMALQSSLQ
jgi:valyl-tRNA synthetase